MRLLSKQELLRVYPTWDASKQKRMAVRITVKHGRAFLRLLRSGSSRRASQPKSPVTVVRGKHKLTPDRNEKSRKRVRKNGDRSSPEKVSSDILQKDRERPVVRLTRSAAKLVQERESVRSPSPERDAVSTGDSGQGSKASNPPSKTAVHLLHGQEGRVVEDETIVSSSLGDPKILSNDRPSTEFRAKFGTDLETVDLPPSRIQAGRHRRKSTCPRKKAPGTELEGYDMVLPDTDTGEESSSTADKFGRGPDSAEVENVHESSKEPKTGSQEKDVDKEFTVEVVAEHSQSVPAGIESPWMDDSGEAANDLTPLINEDPMLADGNLSCASDLSLVPTSSQVTQGEDETSPFAGLRFQSMQGDASCPDCTTGMVDSMTGEGSAAVVNCSLIEEADRVDNLDNLLPGLNMLKVGRAAGEALSLSPVVESQAICGDTGTARKKKSKAKKHKHKSHHKSKTNAASPKSHSKTERSITALKSPVFALVRPASNWTSMAHPITPPSHVQSVDQSTSPTSGTGDIQQCAQAKRVMQTEAVHGPEVNQSITSPCRVHLKDIKTSTHVAERRVCHPKKSSERRDSQTQSDSTHPTSTTGNEDGTLTNVDVFNEPGHYEESSSQTGKAQEDENMGEQSPPTHLPTEPDSRSKIQDFPSPKLGTDQSTLASARDKCGVKKPKSLDRLEKMRGRKSLVPSPRGGGGWEESLRQAPRRVSLFQVGTPSKGKNVKSPKKGAHKSPSKEKILPREETSTKSSQRNSSSGGINNERSDTPRSLMKKKKPREVARPPPLNLNEECADGEKSKRGVVETKSKNLQNASERDESFPRGQLVFGKMKGYCWWPGRIVHHYDRNIPDSPPPLTRWVQWFGDNKYSMLSLGQISDFEKFPVFFSNSTFQKLSLYQQACFQALNEAAKRAGKEFAGAMPTLSAVGTQPTIRERQEYKAKMLERVREMNEWADGGFMPQGPDSIRPSQAEKQPPPPPKSPPPSPEPESRKSPTKRSGSKTPEKEVFVDKRDERMTDVRAGKWTIEEICIGCGSLTLAAKHPLFVGGLCEMCRIEYLEVAYLFDVEGYQAHCCICAEGNQITLCGNDGCYHSYCTVCMDYLVGPQESSWVSQQEPWSCYLCSADSCHGYLTRRHDWQQQLIAFFNKDEFMEFEPLRTYQPLLPSNRRPIRVLSLFDGLGTGLLVLQELGFDVECYHASEVSEEAITVAAVRLKGQIKQVGDVQRITTKELRSWGSFDLLIGGSPCNDLSIVNPLRKGLEGGTGLLFFEFYRILRALQPLPDDPRPFFWLFENVVFMGRKDKHNICRFLECHPVMIDSRHVSPTHRARYYWGNLPGMHRPYVAGADNPLCLQECLEPHCDRQAQFSKVATITTRSNSIRQTKDAILPVIMNGKEDGLWSTELERLFGFPDHYTDIGNLSRTARQKLLGKAWSVPVIKHLMAPLKDYFACTGQKE